MTVVLAQLLQMILLQNVKIDELVICDVVKKITEGDALDLEDLAPFVGQCTVKSGDYSDAKMQILP